MDVNDLTLEVRDRTLKRVGQVTPAHLDLKARDRWSAVGEWSLTLPGDHGMVPYLAARGSGIILLGPSGTPDGVILSGPTRSPTRVRNTQNPDGTYTFSGVTDTVILQGTRAFPNPSIADPQASSQSRSNDTRTGSVESLMRQFVAYNTANGALATWAPGTTWAPAGRLRGLRQYLRLEQVNGGRGLTATKSPRFQNLLELLQELVAYDPRYGFRVVQIGGVLEFQVISARDRTAFVRFDVENGTILSEEVQEGGPTVTDAIVAGAGEGKERLIIRRQSAAAALAEEEWGIPFEDFIDQRQTDDPTELQQKGDERLTEAGGGTAVKMVPADDGLMRVGQDWRAGDTVTTVISQVETVARVTEVAYIVGPSGVKAGAALGDVSGFTQKDAESATVQSLDQRVSNLERAGNNVSPSGTIVMTAAASAPEGWLLCDGAVLSRTTYASLFAVIGTTYNTGGESASQFRLPNLKGRAPVGLDAGQTEFDTLGKMGGAKTHTLTTAQMPSHTHQEQFAQNAIAAGGGASVGGLTSGGGVGVVPAQQSTLGAGSGQAHNNLQPYITLNYLIKA